MKMAKKQVPEWLNSSMWSSASHPATPRPLSHSSEPPTETPVAAKPDPPPLITAKRDPPPPTIAAGQDTLPPITTRQDTPPPRSSPETDSNYSRSEISNCDKNNGGHGTDASIGSSSEDVSRQARLMAELSKKLINIKELRKLASEGIHDGAGIRSTVWKLLLGYLPPDRSLWSSELAKKRLQYRRFKEELLVNPNELWLNFFTFTDWNSPSLPDMARSDALSEISRRLGKSSGCDNDEPTCESSGVLSRSDITHGDHPLSLGSTSVWNKFFKDSEVLEQIDRDVKRTHPDMHFFSGDSLFANSNREALKNILIVFAKLNPGIRYVQGMNEILAPIYYIFKNDPDEGNAANAEADSFFCFVELLSGFRDHFMQQLDNSVVGIRSTIAKLSQLLKDHDEELWRHLEIITKVNPQFYAFRWITLLLTQEFNFADSLHIWDTLLSDPEGPLETLLRICCAMLILIRRRLLAGDFTSNLKLLQNYPPTSIGHLLYVANKLRARLSGRKASLFSLASAVCSPQEK